MSQATSAPFTFTACYEVVPDHQQQLADLARDYVAALESAEPHTHALGLYLDAKRQTFTHIQMLADSAAMEEHMGRIQDYLVRAADHVRIQSIDVYGDVGPRLRAALDHNADAGAELTEHVGPAFGFGRSAQPAATG